MPYRFLEDSATADIAFEAVSEDLGGLFKACAEATSTVMVENLSDVRLIEHRPFELENDHLDLLLFAFLEELIYFKDAEQLILRVEEISVGPESDLYRAAGRFAGEPLDAKRHQQRVDVKAVTLHQFEVEKTDSGWRAHVILDI